MIKYNLGALARKLLREGCKLAMFRADFPDCYDFLRDERAAVAEQMNQKFFRGVNKCYFHAHYTNIEGWYDPSLISRDNIVSAFKELCNSILTHTALNHIKQQNGKFNNNNKVMKTPQYSNNITKNGKKNNNYGYYNNNKNRYNNNVNNGNNVHMNMNNNNNNYLQFQRQNMNNLNNNQMQMNMNMNMNMNTMNSMPHMNNYNNYGQFLFQPNNNVKNINFNNNTNQINSIISPMNSVINTLPTNINDINKNNNNKNKDKIEQKTNNNPLINNNTFTKNNFTGLKLCYIHSYSLNILYFIQYIYILTHTTTVHYH